MRVLPISCNENLSRIVRIVICGFKIIGLAPFSHQRSETPIANSPRDNDYTSAFLFSKIGLIYNVLLSILVLIMGALAIPRVISMDYPNKSSITQAIDVMQSILRTLTSCILILSWAFRQKTAASITNRLLEISCLLSGTNKHMSSQREAFAYMVLNFFLWVTFWVSVEAVFNSFPEWFVANIPMFVINWFVVEYSILLGVVAKELESLNENLLNLKEFPNHSIHTPLVHDYLAVLQSFPTQSQLPALQLLHTIRTTLFEVSLDIADFFSLPILPCIACFFLTLVYNVCYLVTPIVIPSGVTALSLTDNINTVTWFCISTFPLVVLAFNVKETLKEVELTGPIVHKLLDTAKRQEVKIELQQFSHQLLHETVSFTAYGFFTLDFTLIQSIFGATVTYLVIIIQFMQSDNTAVNT